MANQLVEVLYKVFRTEPLGYSIGIEDVALYIDCQGCIGIGTQLDSHDIEPVFVQSEFGGFSSTFRPSLDDGTFFQHVVSNEFLDNLCHG
jgi:hypothetical protein